MRATRIHRFGPPEVIAIEELPRPVPGPDQVLVRVEAAGVGPWDAWVRAGRSAIPHALPLTLGADFSGTVQDLGAAVRGLAPGDAVFGVTNASFTGAQAEYALADAARLAAKPRRSSHVEAASVPVVAVTAWQMLFEHADTRAGQTLLVHGGAGNVGGYAVQLAHRAGARVVATAAAADLEYVRELGAEHVIDFRAERFEERSGPVDAVIDTVGGEIQARSFAVLKPGGILVSSVSEPDAAEATRRGVRARFFLVDVTRDRLARIAEALDGGGLRSAVGAVLSLDDVRKAHEMLEGRRRRPRGRIVLRVDEAAVPAKPSHPSRV
jgi:NADPH:quinone reductase-like Zn-dependent oxidoreductase